MARKPKADKGASLAATEDDMPAPPRRGRGKAAAPEPETALGDDLLTTALADDAGPASGRRRSGSKAKGSPDPVPPAEPMGKRGRRSRQMASPEPEAAEPDMAGPEAAEPDEATSMSEQAEPSEAASPESVIDSLAEPAAPAADSPDQAEGAKPAAQWDTATETATFDWPAIESTAAQAGPNQVMAKLLIAARAEGANSRWPL